jgi:hypothetical protein
MPLDRFVLCSNHAPQSAEGQIWLRVATPEQTMLDPKVWPNDTLPLFLACPWCNLVSKHFEAPKAVRPDLPQDSPQFGKVWLRVSFLCGMEGCETPAEFHVLAEVPKNQKKEYGIADEVLRTRVLLDLQANRWSGYLPCGHKLLAVPDRFYRFCWMRNLQGYDPTDPRWDEMRSIK